MIGGGDEENINVYIAASESISEQLQPIAQRVVYFVQEITQGRMRTHDKYMILHHRFRALYYRSVLIIFALIIATVLGIIF